MDNDIVTPSAIMSSKRETFNFEDRAILLELLRQRKSTFGDSRASTEVNMKKKKAWTEVTAAFNTSRAPASRSESQLRDYVKRLKMLARQEKKSHQNSRDATGGGSPPPPLPEWVILVKEVFPHIMKDSYDDDAPPSNPVIASSSSEYYMYISVFHYPFLIKVLSFTPTLRVHLQTRRQL